MKTLLLLTILCLSACSGNDKVYLCNGPLSRVYHRTDHCQGLRKCSTEIEAVEQERAKQKGRRPCRYCY